MVRGKARRVVTRGYIILLMTVFLFYTGKNGYMSISAAKFRAFAALTCGYAVAVSVKDIFRRGAIWEFMKGTSFAQRAAVLYLGLTWLSAIASPYWPETALGASRYEGALTITLYVIGFLLVSAFGRADRVLLWVLGGAVTAESGLCIAQLMGHNPFTLYPEGYNYYDAGTAYNGEYLGTIGNVDLTAAFYCLALPILAYGMARMKGRLRLMLLVPLGLGLYTAARMSVMAGFIGLFAGLVMALPAGLKGRRARLRGWSALAGALLVVFVTVYAVDLPVGPLHEAHCLLHGNIDSSFGSGRVHIWGEVLPEAISRPLLGFGPDTMINGGLTPFEAYKEELGITVVARIDVAHNEYLNIWYHQGLPALGAYIWLLALLAARWIKSAPSEGAAWALGAGILGCCAQAFFGFSMCITAPFFWTALGLLEAGGGRG